MANAAPIPFARQGPSSKPHLTNSEGPKSSILKVIGAHDGIRADQLAAELAIETKETALPIKGLMADKAIIRKGQKRASAYYPKK